MQKIINTPRIIIVLSLIILAGCETTRKTTTRNMGVSNTQVVGEGFDKKEAAVQRVNIALNYLGRQNGLKRAKFHLDRAVTYDANLPSAYYGLGIYYQRIKEYDVADENFKKAIKMDGENPVYLTAYATFLCDRQEYKKADKMFSQAIDIPTYTDVHIAHFNRGLCAQKQNDVDKAQTYFLKALNRNPKMSGALLEMAKIEYTKNRYSRAQQYIKRFEEETQVSAASAWLGLRVAHFLRDKDSIAKYGVILQQSFPDSQETIDYLDEKSRWM